MATLEAFVESVRLGGFTKAAESLSLTPGAISRKMAVLEADMGMSLFNRQVRGAQPTAAGLRFFGSTNEALALILAAADDLRRGADADEEVRISITPSFGAQWLLPRLPAFVAAHPGIRVVPVADNRLVDLEREGFDLAVRYSAELPKNLHAVSFLAEDLCVLVAPAVLERPDASIDLLAEVPILHDTNEEGWRQWLTAICRPDLLRGRGTIYNDYNLALVAAAAGLGAVIGRTALVQNELSAGRLVELIPFRVPNLRSYHLVRPKGAARRSSQVLWNWLLQIA
ncbi:MAG: LysR substrate-binding domain-containing protein [Caldimonas sp.]